MSNPSMLNQRDDNAFAKLVKPTFYFLCKRAFDLLGAMSLLITLSPLMIAIGIMLKSQSKGPILYKCLRLGKNHKVFPCYKFRTMCCTAECNFTHILKNPELKEEWQNFHKIKNDPRIFPFGRFLRKFSLDELPQLLNVLKGDLSLVGPRPIDKQERHEAMQILGSKYPLFFTIKPGMTGIWQTSGRSNISFKERLFLDLSYIEKKSILFDAYLLLKTIPIVLFSKGAH